MTIKPNEYSQYLNMMPPHAAGNSRFSRESGGKAGRRLFITLSCVSTEVSQPAVDRFLRRVNWIMLWGSSIGSAVVCSARRQSCSCHTALLKCPWARLTPPWLQLSCWPRGLTAQCEQKDKFLLQGAKSQPWWLSAEIWAGGFGERRQGWKWWWKKMRAKWGWAAFS